MYRIVRWVHKLTDIDPTLQVKIASTILIIAALWFFHALIFRAVLKRTEDVRMRYTWRKITNYVSVGFGGILLFRVWFEGVQSLATYFGLLSAGLSIALKDMVSGIAAWFFIIFRRPFEVGDRIQIGSHSGDVIDAGVFQFTILEIGNWVNADHSTGRMFHIPNGMIFTLPLANYNKGFEYIWNEVPVMVTFESDWKKAKTILQTIANRHTEHLSKVVEKQVKRASRNFMIFYSNLTPIVYTTVAESGVLLTIRYLCKPRRRRDSEHIIWEEILEEFSNHQGIDFAYPTERRVVDSSENSFCPVEDQKPG